MSAPMAPITILVFLAALLALPLALIAHPANNPTSRITVVGVVYCDTCSTKAFSRHSYFLPGADVHIQCTFKANSPKTRENIEFSVNRTTDRYGVYKLEVPEVDGVDCEEGFAIESVCQASLIGSSSRVCNVPGLTISTNEISVKSKQNNLCIYSLNALSYRPSKKNITACGNHKEELQNSYNSSKFFLPPYGFQWPPFPNFPPLPSLPPLPPLPSLPPLPALPPLAPAALTASTAPAAPRCHPSLPFPSLHGHLLLFCHFQAHLPCPSHSHPSHQPHLCSILHLHQHLIQEIQEHGYRISLH
ncbi:hypothetical protein OIU74_013344 [Salix koriyanagi]|uniref:Pollen Ole e 1 allergen and extensin family protein n=1 Tax=Salix koriyanagi TaxID=2511006 RepID=A0A9Q0T5J6_9ROSI|nr:hypothetical protein OIU74_013344 [Salix koriyanagi]